jgi:hypothetical protein
MSRHNKVSISVQCEYCDEPMEREDDYEYAGLHRRLCPAATYLCTSCGRAWRWIQGEPGLVPLFDASDYGPPAPAWREEP